MTEQFNTFFTDAEIIDVYSDSDAVEDGILFDTKGWFLFYNRMPVNRLTETAIDEISSYFGVTMEDGLRGKVEELLEKVRVSDEDFFVIDEPVKLWLLPNETEGLTLLLPSDY